ncbi:MAG: hypothetical protein M3Y58_04835 [Chloroflexota bacterium]|nr:hypothetical protein [Chloroflexota bacterium]
MVQILTVTNGTTLLRPGIGTLHAAGYRVMMYNAASMRDLRSAVPDLLILAADSATSVQMLLAAIRADAMLHDLPVIVIGGSWDVFAPLPVALLTETVLLPAPFDVATLQDATRMFVPTLVRARRSA